jgi:hypothetical protein
MTANELKIGNLLRDKVTKTELKVIKLTEKDIVTFVIDRSKFPLQDGWGIEPIPLTEEWLLNLGFYKNIDTELFEKGGYQIDISVLKCHFYLPDYGDWYKEIEYVHQLQNLYFALTEQELAVKLN